jgi:hypothetical protein
MGKPMKRFAPVLCAGLAVGCLTSAPSDGTKDSAAGGPGGGGDAVGAGLPQCLPSDRPGGEVGPFTSDPRNHLVIESACAPVGFSGTGRVSRIDGSAETLGGVRTITVVLDAPSRCDSGVSAQIEILRSRVDWGLQVGSRLSVDLIGNRTPFINGGPGGAVVWLPDGSLLAAFFDREGEQYLAAFLARLQIAASFTSDCREVGSPGTCNLAAIRKSMLLEGSVRLQENQSTTIASRGATFHLGLSTARDVLGFTDCPLPPLDGSPLGPTYRLLLSRLP